MALTTARPDYTRSRHLDALLDEVDDLARQIAQAPDTARAPLAQERLLEASVATLALDGAKPDELPDLAEATELADAARSHTAHADASQDDTSQGDTGQDEGRSGTWFDALAALERPTDELVRALELLGAVAGLSAGDLAAALSGDGALAALAELHRRITRGLVAPERAGAPRTTDLAVHDASVGRIVYRPAAPERVPQELARLGRWLAAEGGSEHPVVVSGVLHAQLLLIHPYDAANGRLARTAARLVLRAGGRDPDGLATVETALANDPMGYHAELAGTAHRRDLGIWLERWAEAVAHGLRTSAQRLGLGLGPSDDALAERARAFVAARSGEGFTLADYLAVVDGDRDAAAADLRGLLDAGRIVRVLGSHGLRFTVVGPSAT